MIDSSQGTPLRLRQDLTQSDVQAFSPDASSSEDFEQKQIAVEQGIYSGVAYIQEPKLLNEAILSQQI
jgi:hypothetical protein